MRILLLSICFLSCVIESRGQFSELVGKPYHERLDAISRLYRMADEERAVFADTLVAMRDLAKRLNDQELLLEADLLEVFYDFQNRTGAPDLDAVHDVIHRAQREQVVHIACRANQMIAKYHWGTWDYERAFRCYGRQDSLFRYVTAADFPDKTLYLKDIGEAYYHFGDYRQAIGYFEQVVDNPHPFFESAWKHALNTMGLAYQELGNWDKADSCFLQVLSNNHSDTEIWEGIVAGNLGYGQYVQGNLDAARPLLEKDIRIAEKYQDLGLAAGSSIPLASILTSMGMLSEAKALLDQAETYIERSEQSDRRRHLYPALSRWYMAADQPREAARYLDSALVAEKRYNEKFSGLLLMRANQEIMASQRETALQELRAASERQIKRRNLVLSALFFLVLLIGVVAYRQRQANRLRQQETDLKLLRADRELYEVRRELDELARSVSQNEEAIQHMESDALIEQLNRQVVLTEEGWNKFSDLFGKLYPGYQHRLKEEYPSLTPAEIRCLAMEKLHYTNKEMAALQGISANAVMVTKHRIRKKLGLPSQEEVTRFVQAI